MVFTVSRRTPLTVMDRILLLLAATSTVALTAACGASSPTSHTGGASSSAPTPSSPSASSTTASPPASSTAASPQAAENNNPAGDIPDNQVYVVWSPPGGGWSVKVPEGWARTDLPSGASFTDKLNTVKVEARPATTAPTVASVRDQDLPVIAASSGHYQAGAVQEVAKPAGTAIHARYRADAPVDPVTGKVVNDDVERYVFYKNGTQVVLTLGGPHGADNVDPWRLVSDSFRWTA